MSPIKLYTLKHGDKFKIPTDYLGKTFVKGTDDEDAVLTFLNVDGMYVKYLYHGCLNLIEAYTDVVLIEEND